jgi:hypothetical protein
MHCRVGSPDCRAMLTEGGAKRCCAMPGDSKSVVRPLAQAAHPVEEFVSETDQKRQEQQDDDGTCKPVEYLNDLHTHPSKKPRITPGARILPPTGSV